MIRYGCMRRKDAWVRLTEGDVDWSFRLLWSFDPFGDLHSGQSIRIGCRRSAAQLSGKGSASYPV